MNTTINEIAEKETSKLLCRFSFGADTKTDFKEEVKATIMSALTAATEPLRKELEECQRRCGASEDKESTLQYELTELQKILDGFTPDDKALTVMRIWSNCLGNMTYPKAHWIDSLGKTTRLLNADKVKAQQERDTLRTQLTSLQQQLTQAQTWLKESELKYDTEYHDRLALQSELESLKTSRVFCIGEYEVSNMRNGSIWLSNELGEGMETPEKKLEQHLAKYFKENF
jgi:septal ring factor EnvC (AmiA/AmiB activator)